MDLKLGGYVCVGIGGKNEVVFVLVCRVMFVMLEDVWSEIILGIFGSMYFGWFY